MSATTGPVESPPAGDEEGNDETPRIFLDRSALANAVRLGDSITFNPLALYFRSQQLPDSLTPCLEVDPSPASRVEAMFALVTTNISAPIGINQIHSMHLTHSPGDNGKGDIYTLVIEGTPTIGTLRIATPDDDVCPTDETEHEPEDETEHEPEDESGDEPESATLLPVPVLNVPTLVLTLGRAIHCNLRVDTYTVIQKNLHDRVHRDSLLTKSEPKDLRRKLRQQLVFAAINAMTEYINGQNGSPRPPGFHRY